MQLRALGMRFGSKGQLHVPTTSSERRKRESRLAISICLFVSCPFHRGITRSHSQYLSQHSLIPLNILQFGWFFQMLVGVSLDLLSFASNSSIDVQWVQYGLQYHFMWRISRPILVICLIYLSQSSYLEFPLIRSKLRSDHYQNEPIVCKNETTLNHDAEYHEVCFEKDISHSIMFMNNEQHVMMAIDLTAPISWIKGPDCKIEGSTHPCKRVFETFAEEVKEVKKKVANKFKKNKGKVLVEDAIIEGSSEVIRGEIEKTTNISFAAKDSSRLNNFFELVMLGLFIYGEHDTLKLQSTNFINATEISPNLNDLSDGAISMRFDQTSENSFLNELFAYVKAVQKSVTLFVGENSTITIGGMTAKYTENGYSSIEWIDMPDDEGFGKLPRLSNIGMQDREQDSQGEIPEELTAVLSLSASYIGLPEAVLNSVFSKYMGKEIKCTVNSKTYFLQCSASAKKKLQKLKEKNIYFDFGGKNIMLPLASLIEKEEKTKIILNIKKTFNNRVILGEPVFLKHFIVLDYSKNKFGFANKRVSENDFFVSVVTLVRFLCFIFVIGCSFVICFQPCRKMFKAAASRSWLKGGEGNEGRRLKQYSPIQDNPYEELKGKIQEVISSNEKEDVEGI